MKMLSKLASLSVCVLGLLLFSCDAEHVKDYYVVNAYEESIAINYQDVYGKGKSLEIEVNDTVLIFSYRYVFGTVGVDNDGKFAIVNMILHNNDKSTSITQNDWKYEKRSKYHADYYLIIDSTLLHKENRRNAST